MGVYVKGMEMPTNCPCELTGVGYDLCCSFVCGIPKRVREYYECCENGTRPDWCPLVPVPPHGRLGDLDKLEKSFREDADAEWNRFAAPVNWADAFDDVANIIADAPTIIDAKEAIV